MSKMQQDTRAALDFPEFRAACAAERKAVAQAQSIRDRIPRARMEVILRKQDRNALASRMASGEDVTGAHVRTADEAVQNAEATVTLLQEALPKAHAEAYSAARARDEAADDVWGAFHAPFARAREEARVALDAARVAFDKADAEVRTLPAETRARLDEVKLAHGFDRQAGEYVDRVESARRHNEAMRADGRPEQELP